MDKKTFCRPKDFKHLANISLKWQDLAKKREKKWAEKMSREQLQ